jgi:hypothetical protein
MSPSSELNATAVTSLSVVRRATILFQSFAISVGRFPDPDFARCAALGDLPGDLGREHE